MIEERVDLEVVNLLQELEVTVQNCCAFLKKVRTLISKFILNGRLRISWVIYFFGRRVLREIWTTLLQVSYQVL